MLDRGEIARHCGAFKESAPSARAIGRHAVLHGVGALREEASDVDTSLVSRARGQTSTNDQGIVSVSSFATRLGQDKD